MVTNEDGGLIGEHLSSFGDVGFVAFAVNVVLPSTASGLDRSSTAIIVGTRRIIPGSRSLDTSIGVSFTTS